MARTFAMIVAVIAAFGLCAMPTTLAVTIQRRTPLVDRALGSTLHARQATSATPDFPSDIPSCVQCEANYSNIDSCAEAAPVLANFSMIIFNPGAFISIIECACGDTFQSAYPQCVDCFEQTNQTSFLNASSSDLPGIITGIRNICALESTLLGGAASADGEVTPTSSAAAPTTSSNASAREVEITIVQILVLLVLSFCATFAI